MGKSAAMLSCFVAIYQCVCVCVFRVMLVDFPFNPLKPKKKEDSLIYHASSKAK